MDVNLPTYSVREANDENLSSLLDELEESGWIAISKHGTKETLLISARPDQLRRMQSMGEEMTEEAFEQGDEEIGRFGMQAFSWMDPAIAAAEQEEVPDKDSPLVWTVTDINRKGISWMCRKAKERGVLIVTRYEKVEALVMSFSPEGVEQYSNLLIELANQFENTALDQFTQAMRQARDLRDMAVRYRDHLKPLVTQMQEENAESTEEETASDSSESD